MKLIAVLVVSIGICLLLQPPEPEKHKITDAEMVEIILVDRLNPTPEDAAFFDEWFAVLNERRAKIHREEGLEALLRFIKAINE